MEEERKGYDCRLSHPSRICISGASGSGKTNLLDFIIRNQSECFNFEAYSKEKKSSSSSSSPRRKGFDRIILFYSIYQDVYASWISRAGSVLLIKYLPDDWGSFETDGGHILNPKEANLVIFDDILAHSNSESELKMVSKFYSMFSHHYQATVCLVSQAVFGFLTNQTRVISKNTEYLFLTPQNKDVRSLQILSSQLFPRKGSGNSGILVDAFHIATSPEEIRKKEKKKRTAFLLVDMKSTTPESYRLRTSFTNDECLEYFKPLLDF